MNRSWAIKSDCTLIRWSWLLILMFISCGDKDDDNCFSDRAVFVVGDWEVVHEEFFIGPGNNGQNPVLKLEGAASFDNDKSGTIELDGQAHDIKYQIYGAEEAMSLLFLDDALEVQRIDSRLYDVESIEANKIILSHTFKYIDVSGDEKTSIYKYRFEK